MFRNLFTSLCLLTITVIPVALLAQHESDFKFIDAKNLMILGQGFEKTIGPYGRMPEALKDEFRPDLLFLGRNSAGVAVRFSSNSPMVSAKWTLTNNYSMNHMAMTGIKGLDLYVLVGSKWMFIGTARPGAKENFSVFVKGMAKNEREFMAFLPLYDGVESLQIGVAQESDIGMPKINALVKSESSKPIVIYGTSITQGGCASRPGMGYTSILSRLLSREVVNLGFSGNGRLDFSMSKAIAMTDPSVIVLDCLPNTTYQSVKDSAYRFITNILNSHPSIPLYMVENPNFANLIVDKTTAEELQRENAAWLELYTLLRSEGHKNIRYIKAYNILGDDNEGTVDGVHPTDLGMYRMAQKLFKELKRFKVILMN